MISGTPPRGGVYHAVGNAICRFVNAGRERHGLRCLVAPSAGSVANIEALRSGEWAYVIVQSDVQHAALTGHNQFGAAGPLSSLRAVFSLHGEPFTVMARGDSGIRTLADAKGRRVNLGREGSGMRALAEEVLTAFGWKPSDFPPLGALAPEEQEKALCQNEIDVATFVVGLVVERRGQDNIDLAGRPAAAERYRMVTPNVAGDLWYAEAEIVRGRLEARGETLDYIRMA